MKNQYPYDDWKTPRHTARGIVIKDNKVLLIERWRKGLHYFSIPGGGIENGEQPQQTAEREIFEETSVKVIIKQTLYEMHDPIGHIHTVFLCEYKSGEPKLRSDSEEAQSMRLLGKNDAYVPAWIPQQEINTLPFLYWAPIGRQLARDVEHGWPKQPVILHAHS